MKTCHKCGTEYDPALERKGAHLLPDGKCTSCGAYYDKDLDGGPRAPDGRPMALHDEIIGRLVRIRKCEAREHGANDGCVCELYGETVQIGAKYDTPFAGMPSYNIRDLHKRVRRDEVELLDLPKPPGRPGTQGRLDIYCRPEDDKMITRYQIHGTDGLLCRDATRERAMKVIAGVLDKLARGPE